MTQLQALQTIAAMAPRDSYDAHKEFVPAEVVYEFERMQLCDSETADDAEVFDALPEDMPAIFETLYTQAVIDYSKAECARVNAYVDGVLGIRRESAPLGDFAALYTPPFRCTASSFAICSNCLHDLCPSCRKELDRTGVKDGSPLADKIAANQMIDE